MTGSREWTDRELLRRALIWAVRNRPRGIVVTARSDVVVAHGAQGTYEDGVLVKGADMMADEVALDLGMLTKRHPADWLGPCRDICRHGPRRVNGRGQSYCQAAGMYRNGEMVGLGADVCLGFPLGRSQGTRGCMRLARLAGIPVVDCTRGIDLSHVAG